MIAEITGKISQKYETFLVMTVGGLGYKINTPKETAARLTEGETVTLSTHLAVKEDALDLYGFSDEDEKIFFELLIGISGIGPKGALGILNLAPLRTLQESIAAGDSGYLTKVSGIGKKTANKLVLELKDKVTVSENTDTESPGPSRYQEESETLEALEALGYNAKESRDALAHIPEDAETPNEKIREALKYLGKK